MYLEGPNWFKTACADKTNVKLAYFSAEFGIHECLPIYAGGLGILAGDHLKSASDLGIPIVAIGLLYQKGYFRQYLNVDGWQQEVYVENDFYNMPLQLVRDSNGQPMTIRVEYPGREVFAQIWCAQLVAPSYICWIQHLPTNSATDQMITTTVYGGDTEMRIRQEIMLGIGGMRALAGIWASSRQFAILTRDIPPFPHLSGYDMMMKESKMSPLTRRWRP